MERRREDETSLSVPSSGSAAMMFALHEVVHSAERERGVCFLEMESEEGTVRDAPTCIHLVPAGSFIVCLNKLNPVQPAAASFCGILRFNPEFTSRR